MTVVILQRLKLVANAHRRYNWGSRPVQPVARRRSSDNAPDVGIRIENLVAELQIFLFRTVSFPLILPGWHRQYARLAS